MIEVMQTLRPHPGDSDDARRGREALSSTAYVSRPVGELTERELDLQRRLVRQSLLLRAA
jgi:hypothetical protein